MVCSVFTAKNKYTGGNPVCPRPTPTWQKGIGDFFGGPPRKPEKENQKPRMVEDDEEAGGSGISKASRKYVVAVQSGGFYLHVTHSSEFYLSLQTELKTEPPAHSLVAEMVERKDETSSGFTMFYKPADVAVLRESHPPSCIKQMFDSIV